MEEFRKLILATELYIELIDINTKPNVVRLFMDADRTKEIRLVDEEETNDEEPIIEENQPVVEAFVSWLESSNDFYLQEKNTIESIEHMVERLVDAPSFTVVEDPKVGDLCAARFVDDDAFYRATILANNGNDNGMLKS